MNDNGGGGMVASAVPGELRFGASAIRSWTTGVRVRAGGIQSSAGESSRMDALMSLSAVLRTTAERHEVIASSLDGCADAFLAADAEDSTLASVIEIAVGEAGYIETKTNRTKYGKWFGMDGQPWCAQFVSWCFEKAGTGLPQAQSTKGYASVRVGWLHAVRNKQLVWKPKAGDIFLIRTGTRGEGHTGIVVSIDDKTGVIHTIEGNTNASGSREGTTVRQRTRAIGSINQGFWRPHGVITAEDRIAPPGANRTWRVAGARKKRAR